MQSAVIRIVDDRGVVRVLGIDDEGFWASPEPHWPRIDVGDGTAFPGLVDAHAHLTSADPSHMDGTHDYAMADRIAAHAGEQLAAGVLLVLDKGTHHLGSVALTVALPAQQRPEVQLAGRFLATPGGYYAGYAVEVAPEELASTVASARVAGVDWVKVIGDWPRRGLGAVPNFGEAQLRAAVDVAHRNGRKVAIHTAAPETPGMAVRAGVDSIEHGLFLTEDDLAELGARGGAWVPTISAMEHLAEALGPQSSGGRLLQSGLDNVRRLLPHAAGAGVAVMAGTDLALAHGEVAREAARLVAYGLAEADAVAAVTTTPRDYLGEPGFASGRPADVVVVAEPGSVEALAAPRLVVRRGTVILDRRV